MIINVEDFVQSKIIKRVEIEVVNYTLNTSCLCNVNFMDSTDNKISSVLVYVDGDEFNIEWVSDDNLIDIILRKVGLNRLPN
jgi:hypothetical protein